MVTYNIFEKQIPADYKTDKFSNGNIAVHIRRPDIKVLKLKRVILYIKKEGSFVFKYLTRKGGHGRQVQRNRLQREARQSLKLTFASFEFSLIPR